jgi:hypothetical protein
MLVVYDILRANATMIRFKADGLSLQINRAAPFFEVINPGRNFGQFIPP